MTVAQPSVIETPAEVVDEQSRPRQFGKNSHAMLSTAQTSHMAMSTMADSKASMLMAATFVVFSLCIDRLSNDKMTMSLMVLGGFALAATVLCVMAIKPKISHPQRGLAPGANLLFFGAFAGLKESEFIDRVLDTMADEERTYRAMARDVYQNGWVLQHKKYKYLAYAFNTFLVGLGVTILTFVWEMIGS